MFTFALDSVELPDFESTSILLMSPTAFISTRGSSSFSSSEFAQKEFSETNFVTSPVTYETFSVILFSRENFSRISNTMANSVSDIMTSTSIASRSKYRDAEIIVIYREILCDVTK